MIEETTEKKITKKRIAVAVMLSLAAFGTRYLPGHPMIVNEPEPVRTLVSESDDSSKPIIGHNSLLGDAGVEQTAAPISAAYSSGLRTYRLETSSLIDQAGIASIVDQIDAAPADSTLAASSGDAAALPAAAAAVPEPSALGYIAIAAAPLLLLRRPRHRRGGH